MTLCSMNVQSDMLELHTVFASSMGAGTCFIRSAYCICAWNYWRACM